MGRSETPLDPTSGPVTAFAHELRQLRHAAGSPSYRALARRAGYSAAALSAAASGSAFPSLSVTLAYVGACGGSTEEWAQRWHELDAKLAAERSADLTTVRRAAAGTTLVRPGRVPPRELPPDVYAFAGRNEELAQLDRVVGEGQDSAVVILAVSGTAGVGKTALAVHWAHRVASRYPDGQLYVDLRGFGPEPPTEPAEVLAGFLRALGVDAVDVPYELAERSALYRSLLADRQMLVLLDNAPSAEVVRPLLPGSPSCLALVTSRDSLAGLVARHGARRIELPRLPAHEALDLLSTLIGARVAAEPDAATALVEGCARLPLALRIAAELAVTRPASSLADLVTELGDEQCRLERLDAGTDERTALGTVLSWSYHRLPAPAATLFRLLGLHPGPDLDAHAAAALLGTDLDEARRLLDMLVRAHLVEPVGIARYGQHDLLRAYAARLSLQADPLAERRGAVTRLLDCYLATSVAAMDLLVPAERGARPRGPRTDLHLPALTDPAAARSWLDAHRPALVAAIGFAAGQGWPTHAGQLAETLWWYVDAGGHYPDGLVTQGHALAAARARGDRAGEATALHHVATVFRRWGRYAEATEHYRQALEIQRETGDEAGVGRTLASLGVLARRQGRYAEAVEHYRQALDIHRAVGDRLWTGWTLGNIAIVYDQLGRYAEAVEHHRRALDILHELEEWSGAAITLGNLGVAYGRLGRYAEAVEHLQRALDRLRESGDRAAEGDFLDELGVVHYRWGGPDQAYGYFDRALAIHRELGNREGEAATLAHLGAAYARAGCLDDALRHSREALDIAREIGDRRVEAGALDGIGEALRALGQTGPAVNHHETALAISEELDDRYGRARALDGLGRTLCAAGDPQRAGECWRTALGLFGDLDIPEVAQLRAQLVALDGLPPDGVR